MLTLVLVVVTGIYVYLTWRIANTNQKMIERIDEQHREEIRPNVYAFLEFREQVVARLVVENKGRSPAYNLRASISDDFFQFGESHGQNLKELPLFNEEISWFPPGARVTIDLAQGFNFDVERDGKNLTPSKFSIGLDYHSKFDHYLETCLIDLSPYANMHIPKTSAEQLGKIAEHLKKISSK